MEDSFSFEKLRVYADARTLVVAVYQLVRAFPVEERFGLSSQMKRSAASVTHNIAEGSSRLTARDKSHFIRIAHGSLMELMSQLLLAQALNFIKAEKVDALRPEVVKISRMLSGMLRHLKEL